MLDGAPGPACALGSEAERMVMVVPERMVMAAYRSTGVVRHEHLEPRLSKGRIRRPGKGRTPQLLLEGGRAAGNSAEETPNQEPSSHFQRPSEEGPTAGTHRQPLRTWHIGKQRPWQSQTRPRHQGHRPAFGDF